MNTLFLPYNPFVNCLRFAYAARASVTSASFQKDQQIYPTGPEMGERHVHRGGPLRRRAPRAGADHRRAGPGAGPGAHRDLGDWVAEDRQLWRW